MEVVKRDSAFTACGRVVVADVWCTGIKSKSCLPPARACSAVLSVENSISDSMRPMPALLGKRRAARLDVRWLPGCSHAAHFSCCLTRAVRSEARRKGGSFGVVDRLARRIVLPCLSKAISFKPSVAVGATY